MAASPPGRISFSIETLLNSDAVKGEGVKGEKTHTAQDFNAQGDDEVFQRKDATTISTPKFESNGGRSNSWPETSFPLPSTSLDYHHHRGGYASSAFRTVSGEESGGKTKALNLAERLAGK